jgi:murein DD-endopeptidase MepM/ murein hydrolase activator NlpD
MRGIKLFSLVVLSTLLLSAGVSATTASEPNPRSSTSTGCSTFTHPEFGISFSYPVDWHIENYLSMAEPSGTIFIASMDPETLEAADGNVPIRAIHVGIHLVEWEEPITPRAWANAYDEATSKLIGHENARSVKIVDLVVDGHPAVRKIAVSPLLTYDAVTVKRGGVIWFIWSNSESQHRETFERIVQSLQWDDTKSPLSLEELGIEPTAKLDPTRRTLTPPSTAPSDASAAKTSPVVPRVKLLGAPSGYRMPFDDGYYITAGPGPDCGSDKHTGNALRAIDYGTPRYTLIRNSAHGSVYFNGWDSSGYGNLVGVEDFSNRIAWYAHLNSRTSLSVGSGIWQGMSVGRAGSSGCSPCGPHLHFHVRTTSSVPVDIRDIPDTTWDNGDLTWSNGLCDGDTDDSWAEYP